jgi:flagellin
MTLGDVSADAIGNTSGQNVTAGGEILGTEVASIQANGTGSATFTYTPSGGQAQTINVDLSNVSDDESMASALNASLNGIGITATSDGTDVAFGGHIADGATLTAVYKDGASTPATVTPATALAFDAAGTYTAVASDIDISTAVGSSDALAIIDNALTTINDSRASLGAVQNRFSHTINNLANIQENVSASRSRIQDTDFAVETAVMTKNQILQQAGTSILSQANQIPQAAISLLGG